MKIARAFRLAGISLAAILTFSCGESGSDFIKGLSGIGANNVLQNSQLGFAASETLPEGETDCITDVKISGSALSGGSTFIIITSTEQLEEIYLQIGGDQPGYYVHEVKPSEDETRAENGDYIYTLVLEFYQRLTDDEALEFTVSGKTVRGEVAEVITKEVEAIQVGAGALQISLSWDRTDDLDLYVITPSDDTLYFANKEVAGSGNIGDAELDVDSNAGCNESSEGWGINSENVYFKETLADGTYKVLVELYKKCGTEKNGARYNVTANVGGTFTTFSDKQSGQFDGEITGYRNEVTGYRIEGSRVVIGEIKIQNGRVQY